MLPYNSSSRSKLYRNRRNRLCCCCLFSLFSFLFPLSSVWSNVASSFSSFSWRRLPALMMHTVCLAATTTITFCFSKAYHCYFHYQVSSSRLQIRLWSSSRRRRRKASPEFSCYKRAYFWRLIFSFSQLASLFSEQLESRSCTHTFLLRTLLSKSHLISQLTAIVIIRELQRNIKSYHRIINSSRHPSVKVFTVGKWSLFSSFCFILLFCLLLINWHFWVPAWLSGCCSLSLPLAFAASLE